MKKLYTLLAALVITASTFAQAPEKMSYQAVVRDSGANLVSGQQVGMQISILEGSTAVYVETHTPTTNANGLVSIVIGNGTVVSGTFAAINWASGAYSIQTEIDPTGPVTNYIITGTRELLSVPYVLHAPNGQDSGTNEGDMQYWNGSSWDVVAGTPNEGATLKMIAGVPTWVGVSIGDIRQGGVVFYIAPVPTDLDGDGDLDTGLVCALSDFGSTVDWGCRRTDLPSVPNVNVFINPPSGPGAEIGDGITNTNNILTDCPTAPAALAARSLGPEWFLPSINELSEIYVNRLTLQQVTGFDPFSNGSYWSSSEFDSRRAYRRDLSNGGRTVDPKNSFYNVRAVRAF